MDPDAPEDTGGEQSDSDIAPVAVEPDAAAPDDSSDPLEAPADGEAATDDAEPPAADEAPAEEEEAPADEESDVSSDISNQSVAVRFQKLMLGL